MMRVAHSTDRGESARPYCASGQRGVGGEHLILEHLRESTAMSTKRPRMHALLLGVGLITLCGGMQGTLLGLRGFLEGYSPATLGLIMSGYYVGFLLGAWTVPRSVRLVGHIRVFAALGSFASITILLHSTLVEPIWWVLLRILSGFCFSGLFLVAESWMNSVTPNDQRGHALAIYMFTVSIGFIGGQFAVNLWPADGYESFILASVFISAAIIPLLLSPMAGPRIQVTRRIRLKPLLEASPLGFSTVLAQGMAFGALMWLTAIFARELGYSAAESSMLVGALMLGGLVTYVPIGRISDKRDRRYVLLGLSLVTTVACALVPIIAMAEVLWLLGLAILCVGGAVQPMYAVAISFINDDQSSPEQILSASSAIILINGVGGMLGPFLSSLSMTYAGPASLYIFVALLSSALLAYTLLRMKAKPEVDIEQQSDIAQVGMQTSQVSIANAMDEADHNLPALSQDS